ncbi:MAG: ATPase, T2SS/T4P/T4SS family, partial [Rubrobacteraceae bacterium]
AYYEEEQPAATHDTPDIAPEPLLPEAEKSAETEELGEPETHVAGAEETPGAGEPNVVAEDSASLPYEAGQEEVRDLEPDAASAEGQPDPARRGRRALSGRGKMGEILVSQGKISEEQLRLATEMQREDQRELDAILLSLGYVTTMDLAQAMARRLGLDFMELTENDVDRGLLTVVDQRILRKHGVVPVRVEDGNLFVAMSDPKDLYALEDLRMISGYPVTPVVATQEDIRKVQGKLFALGEGVSEFLEEAASEEFLEDDKEVQLGEGAGSDEAPIIRLVSSILQQAVGDGASDIHVEPQAQEVKVRFRVDGVLREVMSIPQKLRSGVIARLKVIADLNIAERRLPQDGRFSVRMNGGKIDLRVATLPTAFGEKVVLRLLDTANVEADLTKLGFSEKYFESYEKVFTRPYGAILVTGPTGSGKSTTLYATLNELNSASRNIITVEDPVEYRIAGLNQIQVNPRAGLTFASGLRSILRSDPDVIMIGEIRDVETAKISVESSLTGHMVLATLHTNNAPGALTRLTEMGVEPFLTSSAVDCVIAQRLCRRLCGRCKQPTELDPGYLEQAEFPFDLVPEAEVNFFKPVGCDRCGGTGYKGRLGLYELMVVSEPLRDLVVRRASTGEIARVAEEEGMIPLRSDGMIKAAQGITTIEEVLRTVV